MFLFYAFFCVSDPSWARRWRIGGPVGWRRAYSTLGFLYEHTPVCVKPKGKRNGRSFFQGGFVRFKTLFCVCDLDVHKRFLSLAIFTVQYSLKTSNFINFAETCGFIYFRTLININGRYCVATFKHSSIVGRFTSYKESWPTLLVFLQQLNTISLFAPKIASFKKCLLFGTHYVSRIDKPLVDHWHLSPIATSAFPLISRFTAAPVLPRLLIKASWGKLRNWL